MKVCTDLLLAHFVNTLYIVLSHLFRCLTALSDVPCRTDPWLRSLLPRGRANGQGPISVQPWGKSSLPGRISGSVGPVPQSTEVNYGASVRPRRSLVESEFRIRDVVPRVGDAVVRHWFEQNFMRVCAQYLLQMLLKQLWHDSINTAFIFQVNKQLHIEYLQIINKSNFVQFYTSGSNISVMNVSCL